MCRCVKVQGHLRFSKDHGHFLQVLMLKKRSLQQKYTNVTHSARLLRYINGVDTFHGNLMWLVDSSADDNELNLLHPVGSRHIIASAKKKKSVYLNMLSHLAQCLCAVASVVSEGLYFHFGLSPYSLF